MSTGLARSMAITEESHESHETTILVAESSTSIGRELVEQLCADRYQATLAQTVQHARALARARPIRAVILGVLDGRRGALSLLEEIRRSRRQPTPESVWNERMPVIVLSPNVGQLALLRAFEMGADDFIGRVGPYYLELRARLKAVLHRAEGFPAARVLQIGPLEIDTTAHLVRVAGAPVELCRLEYELLVHLARNPAGVCSKQEILHAIWGHPLGSTARTVDSHASRLRRKLDAGGAPGLVVNVWGIGYRLT
jgi:DNA-binding response OmpR family regulator